MKRNLIDIPTEFLQHINSDMAYSYRIIPFNYENNILHIVSDATDDLLAELEILLGKSINIIKEETSTIDFLLQKNYRKNNSITITYSDDFLLNLIHEAKEIGSSDIHFEVFEYKNRVRFRIDGKLLEKYIISKSEYPKIVNRIKIMAGLDISEKRLPQDGRINLVNDHDDFDIRVSSLPTLHGEKLVLRILSKNSLTVQLENLGFSEEELTIYKNSVKKPNGIVLISGPTGSGKTTTLYATLKLLNTNDTNVLTIEDPIEYTLEGVNQVQLKESIGLDFASTLRTFLRQDPDIIMVGEIRDVATANMAIRAALTGHLVLSTIHTNSAWATISRLIDMGVPPFLIASTLNVSVAQRLIRKLCNDCKTEVLTDSNSLPKGILLNKKIKSHFKAIGCPSCYQTGYKGRKAIYEIIPITKELVENIQEKELDITDYLTKKNIATLQDNAINMVINGISSLDEIYPLLIN
ncbi:GspE/PulE family protein [Tenacibaculum finnmarkense]|uniref:GspE/PulE family protein n=1 Tax=Tenacibaculum finnmarkense TaxID=2781243 RepID=UPI001EFBCF05|nr:ATPase, T2SS/T4P/T4SS family [Tenacibaculum finnmarkense]MCG8208212.1 type II/IV secretion system protein [Tenacibaculum finnmarkense genomovar finnmarkense]MCG8724226.1 type II/IV secretion system protein [Tenacibaculum finnmarkense]MCG8742520.1 type II/IV secretion system protein [Tenacibaculum finnmarkense]MCG8765938.1 type II/IV secretion system protein [Tenacibaculum finnmarkense]MCG8778869.1 type II/IV secretion system protein [Tenacibaculum finnmarkense]